MLPLAALAGSGHRCAGGTEGRPITSTPKADLFPVSWPDGALGMLES